AGGACRAGAGTIEQNRDRRCPGRPQPRCAHHRSGPSSKIGAPTPIGRYDPCSPWFSELPTPTTPPRWCPISRLVGDRRAGPRGHAGCCRGVAGRGRPLHRPLRRRARRPRPPAGGAHQRREVL
ncbi:MAG: hypothetical protein AVDCRST_MAG66-1265, partial [uncultured Pseudonocardia sp.]